MFFSGEKVVETKKCRLSGREFFVTDKDLEFYDKISPIFAGKKYSIPSPTLCPDERMRLLMCHVNQRNLYKNKSCFSDIEVISNFGPHCPFPVCSTEEWHSDSWSPREYGRDIVFDTSFFDQFKQFISRVPHWALNQGNNENSEYANYGSRNKSCYLLLTGSENVNVYYASFSYKSENCIDCEYIKESQYCFESFDIQKSYGLYWCQECINCAGSYLLKNCIGCKNCFGCGNLTGKEFYIFNQYVGEEKFQQFMIRYRGLTFQDQGDIKKDIMKLWSGLPNSFIHGSSNENVLGDYI